MKKVIPFLLFAIFLFPKNNFGCSCIGVDTFCESITDQDGKLWTDIFIVRAEITRSFLEGMDIRLTQPIYGEINEREISFYWDLCTSSIDGLEDGKEYIFALSNYSDSFHPLACSVWFLEIDNEVVKGKIAPGIESVDYDDLGSLDNCGDGFGFFSLNKDISIFPNPTIDEIKIENTSPTNELENLELKIFDALGRMVQDFTKPTGILPEEAWVINMQNFPPGLYVFKLSDTFSEKVYKIVKQ